MSCWRAGARGSYHLDVQFLVTVGAGTDYVVSEESHDLAWFGIDALPAGIDRSVSDLVDRARRRIG